ncbi:E3 ubiquitin-protein ligase TRIM38-like isoform X2 [Acipenser ruthenus]|uniref:E3 ubiquitin-protein ligase TRIM38-like isoform X2 n=1 Tax=Acipenser ruthenus TaxID=7906 RepID=UPI002740AFB7|nr:E3 ubiquitin-protein ligase TRIM38-like isoform X2 [Acipenser ruthenus]
MATQHSLVLGIVSGAYERLRKEDSFEAGLYVALAAAVGILVAVILYFTCYTGILKRENERLGKVLGSLKREKETLGKEKDALQKNYEILKSKNERLGKEDSSEVGFCVVVVMGISVELILCCVYYIALLKIENERLTREKEDLQKQNGIVSGENERLGKEDCFEAGLYFALAAAVGILLVVILYFACYTGILKRENERLGKEKEALQKNYEILKSKNERLGKEASSEVGFYVAVAAAVWIFVCSTYDIGDSFEKGLFVILCFAFCKARVKREIKRLIREKEDLQKNFDSLKGKNERLGKEKENLQKNDESLKQEKGKVEADFKELRRNTNMCVYAVDRDWKKLIEACVNVTLDPDTASPSLTVSEDGSRVKFTGERSADQWPSVLGREGFTSGRHYWEVEVGEKGYWVLGVSTHPHEKSIPQKPGEGYWLVTLAQGKICTAVSQSGDQILKLEKMCKMWGVYLDHGGGRLSFYNAETRFHIHTLEGSFPGQVYPIFSPGSHDKGPLVINTKVKNV